MNTRIDLSKSMRSEEWRLRCDTVAAALSGQSRRIQDRDGGLGYTGVDDAAGGVVGARTCLGATGCMAGEAAACDELSTVPTTSIGSNFKATSGCAARGPCPSSRWPATQGAHARPRVMGHRKYTNQGLSDLGAVGCAPPFGAQTPGLCIGGKNAGYVKSAPATTPPSQRPVCFGLMAKPGHGYGCGGRPVVPAPDFNIECEATQMPSLRIVFPAP